MYNKFDVLWDLEKNDKPPGFDLSWKYCIRSFQLLCASIYFETFSGYRALLSSVGHNLSDIFCCRKKMSQVKELTFSSRYVWGDNTALKFARIISRRGAQYQLHKASALTSCYADSPFSSNDDLSCQIYMLILLWENLDRFHVLEYESGKSIRSKGCLLLLNCLHPWKRVMPSIYLRWPWDRAWKMICPLHVLVVRARFWRFTYRRETNEQSLMIEICFMLKSYRQFKISEVGYIWYVE